MQNASSVISHPTMLAAKVAARNKVHATLRAAADAYFALARKFDGKKIRKATGEFTKEFKAALPSCAMGDYWNRSDYWLSFVFKVCEQGPRSCTYAEASLYIGDMEGQTLKAGDYAARFNPDNYRTDYTEAEVHGARAAVKAAESALRAAQSRLSYFGEHDAF